MENGLVELLQTEMVEQIVIPFLLYFGTLTIELFRTIKHITNYHEASPESYVSMQVNVVLLLHR